MLSFDNYKSPNFGLELSKKESSLNLPNELINSKERNTKNCFLENYYFLEHVNKNNLPTKDNTESELSTINRNYFENIYNKDIEKENIFNKKIEFSPCQLLKSSPFQALTCNNNSLTVSNNKQNFNIENIEGFQKRLNTNVNEEGESDFSQPVSNFIQNYSSVATENEEERLVFVSEIVKKIMKEARKYKKNILSNKKTCNYQKEIISNIQKNNDFPRTNNFQKRISINSENSEELLEKDKESRQNIKKSIDNIDKCFKRYSKSCDIMLENSLFSIRNIEENIQRNKKSFENIERSVKSIEKNLEKSQKSIKSIEKTKKSIENLNKDLIIMNLNSKKLSESYFICNNNENLKENYQKKTTNISFNDEISFENKNKPEIKETQNITDFVNIERLVESQKLCENEINIDNNNLLEIQKLVENQKLNDIIKKKKLIKDHKTSSTFEETHENKSNEFLIEKSELFLSEYSKPFTLKHKNFLLDLKKVQKNTLNSSKICSSRSEILNFIETVKTQQSFITYANKQNENASYAEIDLSQNEILKKKESEFFKNEISPFKKQGKLKLDFDVIEFSEKYQKNSDSKKCKKLKKTKKETKKIKKIKKNKLKLKKIKECTTIFSENDKIYEAIENYKIINNFDEKCLSNKLNKIIAKKNKNKKQDIFNQKLMNSIEILKKQIFFEENMNSPDVIEIIEKKENLDDSCDILRIFNEKLLQSGNSTERKGILTEKSENSFGKKETLKDKIQLSGNKRSIYSSYKQKNDYSYENKENSFRKNSEDSKKNPLNSAKSEKKFKNPADFSQISNENSENELNLITNNDNIVNIIENFIEKEYIITASKKINTEYIEDKEENTTEKLKSEKIITEKSNNDKNTNSPKSERSFEKLNTSLDFNLQAIEFEYSKNIYSNSFINKTSFDLESNTIVDDKKAENKIKIQEDFNQKSEEYQHFKMDNLIDKKYNNMFDKAKQKNSVSFTTENENYFKNSENTEKQQFSNEKVNNSLNYFKKNPSYNENTEKTEILNDSNNTEKSSFDIENRKCCISENYREVKQFAEDKLISVRSEPNENRNYVGISFADFLKKKGKIKTNK